MSEEKWNKFDKFGKIFGYAMYGLGAVCVAIFAVVIIVIFTDDDYSEEKEELLEDINKVQSEVSDEISVMLDSDNQFIMAAKELEIESGQVIGRAFDNYFSKPSWEVIDFNNNKYVVFTGGLIYDNQPSSASLYFIVDIMNDEQYRISYDRLEINGQTQGELVFHLLISDVFAGHTNRTNDTGKVEAPPVEVYDPYISVEEATNIIWADEMSSYIPNSRV